MARPTNRYARAQARARYRKPKRSGSSLGWNIAIGVIVILGIGGIIASRSGGGGGGGGGSGLAIGDHWHAALGVNVCGEWEPPQPEFTTRASDQSLFAGIHTHDDGIIHMEPQSSADTGDNATVGKFAEFGGWDLESDSFQTWTGNAKRNGDACPDGQPGTVRWAVNGEEEKGNPADFAPRDGDVITIAFVPESQDLSELIPPSVDELPNAAQNE